MLRTLIFNRRRYYLKSTGYFEASSSDNKEGTTILHRAIWIYHNGPIKDGYVVHHIDRDKTNNDLSNLQVMLNGDHVKLHSKESWAARIRHDMICQHCKKPYTTPFKDRSKYCSNACKCAAWRKRKIDE